MNTIQFSQLFVRRRLGERASDVLVEPIGDFPAGTIMMDPLSGETWEPIETPALDPLKGWIQAAGLNPEEFRFQAYKVKHFGREDAAHFHPQLAVVSETYNYYREHQLDVVERSPYVTATEIAGVVAQHTADGTPARHTVRA